MAAEPPVTVERKDAEAVAPSRHDTGETPVTVGVMRRAFRINEIWTVMVAFFVATAAVFGAYKVLLGEAQAAGAEAAAKVETRVLALEQGQRQSREDVHELAKDIRELYRVVPRVRDSKRLEQPLADGGP